MNFRFARISSLVLAFALSIILITEAKAASPMSISYEYSQGIYPAGSSFYLQTGTATYQEWSDSMRVRVNFNVTKKEMDSLYSNLKWYAFTGIEVAKIKAYNRGGDQVTLEINGKSTTKSNAGQSAVKGSFSKWRYEKVTSNLKSFVQKKVALHNVTYKLDLENASNYGVRVAVNDAEVQMHAGKGSVSLLPGKHTILVGLYDGKDAIVSAEAVEVNVPASKEARIRVGDKNIFIIPE
ncbi:MAG: hypothetical protein KAZ30_00680 [Candidatus Magasanikbacteria bacterium]|nr:hypothetical protein [Candidatus Magasanikbacteria bacterium]